MYSNHCSCGMSHVNAWKIVGEGMPPLFTSDLNCVLSEFLLRFAFFEIVYYEFMKIVWNVSLYQL